MINKVKKIFMILFSFRFKLILSLFKGVAAGTEHLKFLKSLENINTILDIGAHKGQFALISKYVFENAKIYSFDPLKSSKYKYNKILKPKNGCFFFNTAIGNKNGYKQMNISKNSDSSSILKITNKQIKTFRNTEKIKEEKIKIQKLHNCINKKKLISPCLMKVDVQGYELEVLKGSEKLLQNFDYLYVECSSIEFYKEQPFFKDIYKWLKKRNFIYIRSYNNFKNLNNKTIQADYFFKRLI